MLYSYNETFKFRVIIEIYDVLLYTRYVRNSGIQIEITITINILGPDVPHMH